VAEDAERHAPDHNTRPGTHQSHRKGYPLGLKKFLVVLGCLLLLLVLGRIFLGPDFSEEGPSADLPVLSSPSEGPAGMGVQREKSPEKGRSDLVPAEGAGQRDWIDLRNQETGQRISRAGLKFVDRFEKDHPVDFTFEDGLLVVSYRKPFGGLISKAGFLDKIFSCPEISKTSKENPRRILLTPLTAVSFLVLDPDGGPLAGATVDVLPYFSNDLDYPLGRTGADGRFVLSRLEMGPPEGKYGITVVQPAFGRIQEVVPPGFFRENDPVVVRFARPVRVVVLPFHPEDSLPLLEAGRATVATRIGEILGEGPLENGRFILEPVQPEDLTAQVTTRGLEGVAPFHGDPSITEWVIRVPLLPKSGTDKEKPDPKTPRRYQNPKVLVRVLVRKEGFQDFDPGKVTVLVQGAFFDGARWKGMGRLSSVGTGHAVPDESGVYLWEGKVVIEPLPTIRPPWNMNVLVQSPEAGAVSLPGLVVPADGALVDCGTVVLPGVASVSLTVEEGPGALGPYRGAVVPAFQFPEINWQDGTFTPAELVQAGKPVSPGRPAVFENVGVGPQVALLWNKDGILLEKEFVVTAHPEGGSTAVVLSPQEACRLEVRWDGAPEGFLPTLCRVQSVGSSLPIRLEKARAVLSRTSCRFLVPPGKYLLSFLGATGLGEESGLWNTWLDLEPGENREVDVFEEKGFVLEGRIEVLKEGVFPKLLFLGRGFHKPGSIVFRFPQNLDFLISNLEDAPYEISLLDRQSNQIPADLWKVILTKGKQEETGILRPEFVDE